MIRRRRGTRLAGPSAAQAAATRAVERTDRPGRSAGQAQRRAELAVARTDARIRRLVLRPE